MVEVSDINLTCNIQQATNAFFRWPWTSRSLDSIIRYVQLSIWQQLTILRRIVLPLTLQLIVRLRIFL
jgi:hypothetical protein